MPDEPKTAYETDLGVCLLGTAEAFIERQPPASVDLIFTSPPYPLNRKKKYGNRSGEEYRNWLCGLAPGLTRLLKPSGSIVIELGNAWEPGRPVMSTLALETLLSFRATGQLHLCQQFVWYNPARLPTPAQWVNIERVRVKDSFTHLWWMAPTPRPKADNRRVLKEYSRAMQGLLRTQSYNSGRRPSEHSIGAESFLQDRGGAIPSNVLVVANTVPPTAYREHCERERVPLHPARMPQGVAEFFVRFLTEPGDLVYDPFAGSNITGAASENLGRRWIATELQAEYVIGSRGRFPNARCAPSVRDGNEGHVLAAGV